LLSIPPLSGASFNNNQIAKWFRRCNFCLRGVSGFPWVYRNYADPSLATRQLSQNSRGIETISRAHEAALKQNEVA
jgi:hypothetical protein